MPPDATGLLCRGLCGGVRRGLAAAHAARPAVGLGVLGLPVVEVVLDIGAAVLDAVTMSSLFAISSSLCLRMGMSLRSSDSNRNVCLRPAQPLTSRKLRLVFARPFAQREMDQR